MDFRPYTPADLSGCLAVFDSNAERYFSPGDREEFAAFLSASIGFFGVLVDEGTVVGCGGIARSRGDDRCAVLTWGMIHAERHGQGLGRMLTLERLRWLDELPDVTRVTINTSGATVGFYRKLGFRDVAFQPNGYRPGLDRYDLELSVDEELRRHLV